MPRRESPTGPRRLAAAELTRQATALKKAGKTYEEIRRILGCSKGAVVKAVQRGLAELKAETAADAAVLRTIEAARLDTAQAAIWPAVLKGDLGAIDRFVRVSQRRAALLGLDAPTQRVLTGPDGGPIQHAVGSLADALRVGLGDEQPEDQVPDTDPPRIAEAVVEEIGTSSGTEDGGEG